MLKAEENNKSRQILYSCYYTRSREGEQFVPEHVFSYQISGKLIMNDGDKEYIFHEGSFRLTKRSSLIKFIKQPPENGEYKNVSVYLDQNTLKDFSREYGYTAESKHHTEPVVVLQPDPLLTGYIASLKPYEDPVQAGNDILLSLKLKEAIAVLLKTNPYIKDVLFDFTEPGKIDLEGFMNKNFHFNISLKRFAYLTGRSLATFKRDFEKLFHLPPSRWLQQKRLQEAHYLIKEKGRTPSDVYLDLGFEDLSHFSFAFKKMYGMAPSKL